MRSENKQKLIAILAILCLLTPNWSLKPIKAATVNPVDLKNEADKLNDSLNRMKNRVAEIKGLINTYNDKIKQQEEQEITLENQILLLQNRVREKELRTEETKAQIEVIGLEVQGLEGQIGKQEDRIATHKVLVSDLLRQIRQTDDVNAFHVLLSHPNLSSYFDNVEQIQKIQTDLSQNLKRVVAEKESLQNSKKDREDKKLELEDQKKQLTDEQDRLEQERNSLISLLAETKSKQDEFNRVLNELRQQNEATSDEIATLEDKLKDKLNSIDEALARGETLLIWPVPVRKITAKFHDPNYPFKNLFQHPGIDIRAEVGTPVKAAAGGYVAWTKIGSMYGNYLMIIHPGKLATIYAHLSKFNAKPGTYVERGDVIGFSGGMPGMQGAGLSTGPHLHFEVRQDGIPVDPEGFLPVAIETDP